MPEVQEQFFYSVEIPSNPRTVADVLITSTADETRRLSELVYPAHLAFDPTSSTRKTQVPTCVELSVLQSLLNGAHSPLHAGEEDKSPFRASLSQPPPGAAPPSMISNAFHEVAVPSQRACATTAQITHSILSIITQTVGNSKDENLTRQLQLANLWGGSPSAAPMPRKCLDSWFSEELPSPCGGEKALPRADLEFMQDPFALQYPAMDANSLPEANTGNLAPDAMHLQGATKTQRSSKHWCHFHLGEDMIAKRSFELNKKIIGRGGCNMRAIFDATGAKVRLRGRGSGHLEGGKEAPVPLMLVVTCVGSTSTFRTAIKMAVEVLHRVEAQFHATCSREEQLPCFRVASLSPGAIEHLSDILASVPSAHTAARLPQMQ